MRQLVRRGLRRRLRGMRVLSMLVGIGFRKEIAAPLLAGATRAGILELTAEHFFGAGGEAAVERLRSRYPLVVHGLGLSLGTPGPLDEETLAAFARVARVADPLWVSEHVAFTRTREVDLGHLNPVLPCAETVDVLAEHAAELADRCGKPVLLENIASHLRLEGALRETELLNRVCEKAGCGLLLDVTNLFVNARNHGFDPVAWLRELEPARIRQLHVVGYSQARGVWHDRHAEPIQLDLWDLVTEAIRYAPVEAVILERDLNLDSPDELDGELALLEGVCRA